jgi:hypothetical protein
MRKSHKARSIEPSARGIGRLAGRCSELCIPGTNLLANITTEHPVPHEWAQLERNHVTKLNGQIRDAPPRIDDRRTVGVASKKRIRRTRIDTSVTASTMLFLEGPASRQLKIDQQESEKEPGATPGIDQNSVLPEPPESRSPGQIPLAPARSRQPVPI